MTIIHKFDSTANDSDKTFTVPTGVTWRLDWLRAKLVTTATAGNRQMNVEVYDDSNVLRVDYHAGAVQAASLTRTYTFHPGIYRETAFVDTDIQVSISQNLILLPGWYVRIRDTAAVDAAADDLTINMQVSEHPL